MGVSDWAIRVAFLVFCASILEGMLVVDLLHSPIKHGMQIQKCSQLISGETANERYNHSCYEEGEAFAGKSGPRKEEEEILDPGLEKWMQFG